MSRAHARHRPGEGILDANAPRVSRPPGLRMALQWDLTPPPSLCLPNFACPRTIKPTIGISAREILELLARGAPFWGWKSPKAPPEQGVLRGKNGKKRPDSKLDRAGFPAVGPGRSTGRTAQEVCNALP